MGQRIIPPIFMAKLDSPFYLLLHFILSDGPLFFVSCSALLRIRHRNKNMTAWTGTEKSSLASDRKYGTCTGPSRFLDLHCTEFFSLNSLAIGRNLSRNSGRIPPLPNYASNSNNCQMNVYIQKYTAYLL